VSDKQRIDQLQAQVTALATTVIQFREFIANRPVLHRKDLMRRYGWSARTMDRRRHELPRPALLQGHFWTIAALEAAERTGTLPEPISA